MVPHRCPGCGRCGHCGWPRPTPPPYNPWWNPGYQFPGTTYITC